MDYSLAFAWSRIIFDAEKRNRIANMRKIKIKNKKGDLPSGFTVMIIILIIGFAILLFFLFKFLWQENIDKEVCHESVVIRGTASSVSEMAEDYIPLKCKTAKYCITSGLIGGKCDEEGQAFDNEKDITKVKVSNDAEKGKEQVEKFIAGEIINCWSMMGEGKINLFTQYMAKNFALGSIASSCVICNRIAFDEKSLDKINLASIDVQEYMRVHKAPGKELSYLGYIAGEGGKISIKKEEDVKLQDSLQKVKETTVEGGTSIKYDETSNNGVEIEQAPAAEIKNDGKVLSVMFMQVIAPEHSDVLKNTLYAAAGGAGSVGVFAPIITLKVVTSAIFWKIIAIPAAIFTIGQQVNVYVQRNFAAAKCQDVSIGGTEREGCSVVRTVNYNLEDISKYCTIIESIP